MMQNSKDLALMMFKKKLTLLLFFIFFNEEICELFPLNTCQKSKQNKIKKRYIYEVFDVLCFTILQIINLIG